MKTNCARSMLHAVLIFGVLSLMFVMMPSSFVSRAQSYPEPPSVPDEPDFRLRIYPDGSSSGGNIDLLDGDAISIQTRPNRVPRDRFEIRLESSPTVTWWKGIAVYKKVPPPTSADRRWVKLGETIFTQDSVHRSAGVLTIRMDQLPVLLIFEKAKFLGVHAPMHGMWLKETQTELAGQSIRFRWNRDR